MDNLKNNSGFTVIELLVTAAIFIIIFTVAIMDFRGGENINRLQLAADQVAVAIRRAQTESLSGSNKQEIAAAGGFGVYFDSNNNGQYVYFRDNGDGGNNFDPNTDTIIETVSLPPNITLNFLTEDPLSIVFTPPKPDIYINGLSTSADLNIILFSSKNNAKQGNISLNGFTGRVTAEIQDR